MTTQGIKTLKIIMKNKDSRDNIEKDKGTKDDKANGNNDSGAG